jgi:hypothetical protein
MPLRERAYYGLDEIQARLKLTRRELVYLIDTLGIMLRAGTITKDMHDAARDFQAQFTIARFDVVRCMPLVRLTGGPGDLTDAQVDARRRVGEALDALGGLGSPAGSCVWHVVGLQRSIREWAIRQGWGGRPVRVEQAQGILIAALGVLARYYRYEAEPSICTGNLVRQSSHANRFSRNRRAGRGRP